MRLVKQSRVNDHGSLETRSLLTFRKHCVMQSFSMWTQALMQRTTKSRLELLEHPCRVGFIPLFLLGASEEGTQGTPAFKCSRFLAT